jgi:hypothetical protein
MRSFAVFSVCFLNDLERVLAGNRARNWKEECETRMKRSDFPTAHKVLFEFDESWSCYCVIVLHRRTECVDRMACFACDPSHVMMMTGGLKGVILGSFALEARPRARAEVACTCCVASHVVTVTAVGTFTYMYRSNRHVEANSKARYKPLCLHVSNDSRLGTTSLDRFLPYTGRYSSV